MRFICFVILWFLFYETTFSQTDDHKNLLIGMKSYISYESEIKNNSLENDFFSVRRAYFTVKKEINNYLDTRMTIDTYEDDDGQEFRIKYLYTNFKLPDISMFDNTNVRVGIIHTPWLDLQTDFYKYRMQGHLYLEKAGIFDSADFGITLFGDLKEGSGEDRKRFGSYTIGMYNGSGYKKFTLNPHKVFQMTMSFYPLWNITQNWNISYLFIRGEGNIGDPQVAPDFLTNSFYSAYGNGIVTFSAEYVFGKGNQEGSLITEDNAVKYDGFSLFGEYKPFDRFAIIGRFDHLNTHEQIEYQPENRIIAGAAWYFNPSNFILLDYETAFHNGFDNTFSEMLKLTLQTKFDHLID